ncbi:MAG: thiamine phosphate synthase [Blastocatellia bacterium]|nr:thiamine phosphate synthase [Blastocatellia bacterium]
MNLPNIKLCLITDRKQLLSTLLNHQLFDLDTTLSQLLNFCQTAAQAGIDIIQVREKDIPADKLSNFVAKLTKETKNTNAKVLVNDRLDIALSYEADGIHLPSNSFPINKVRKLVGKKFIISVAVHSIKEAQLAAKAGADYVLFSPIFDTPSKTIYGPALGLAALEQAVKSVKCPIIALGGINQSNAKEVLDSKVAGLAAIRLFLETSDLPKLVNELKR